MIPLKYKLIHIASYHGLGSCLSSRLHPPLVLLPPRSLRVSHTDLSSHNTKPLPASGFSICCFFCLECSSPRILHRWFLPVFQGSSARGPALTTQAKILTLYHHISLLQKCNSIYHHQKLPCLTCLLPVYSSRHQPPCSAGKHQSGWSLEL